MYYNEFRDLGIECPNISRGRKKVRCPRCMERDASKYSKRKDLSIDYSNGYYKCHSSSCDFKGSVAHKAERKVYNRPKFENKTNLPPKVAKWFDGRGIGPQVLKDVKIESDRRGICFNYFRGDQLVNRKFRKVGEKRFGQEADTEHILYNLNSVKGKEKVIITEGEMDALSYLQAGLDKKGYGVVSLDQGAGNEDSDLTGKLLCLTNSADEIRHVKEWYISMDDDGPGKWTEKGLISRFGAAKCKVINLPDGCKDANDVLVNLPQDMAARVQTLVQCVENASDVPVPGIYTLDDDMMHELDYEYEHGVEKGKTTGFTHIDEQFTWYPGDLTLLTGIPNDGKSQFAKELMVTSAVLHNFKWSCFAPEDMPPRFFMKELACTYMGKWADKGRPNQMTKEEYILSLEYIRNHFFIIYPEFDVKEGGYTLPDNKWLNDQCSFLKMKYGVDAYLKDPWNKIYHDFGGMREDQYLGREISKEKMYALSGEFNACLYVAHPSKMRKDKDGKYPEPDVYDLSGGAMFNNMFDNIGVVYRPNRHDNPKDGNVEVKFKKIKKQSLVGRPGETKLYFKWDDKRYYQYNGMGNLDESSHPLLPQDYVDVTDEELPF